MTWKVPVLHVYLMKRPLIPAVHDMYRLSGHEEKEFKEYPEEEEYSYHTLECWHGSQSLFAA